MWLQVGEGRSRSEGRGRGGERCVERRLEAERLSGSRLRPLPRGVVSTVAGVATGSGCGWVRSTTGCADQGVGGEE